MTDLRATLIRQFRERLSQATAHTPDSLALAVPLGTLADAAMTVFADGASVPAIPTYRDDLARERHWYGVLRAEDVDEGAQFPVLSLHRENATHVLLTLQHGPNTIPVRMTPPDVIDFALAMLSAAYAELPAAPTDAAPAAEAGVST